MAEINSNSFILIQSSLLYNEDEFWNKTTIDIQ